MSDPIFAVKDPATVLAQALADYKTATVSPTNPNGTTLAQSDPRRLHLQAFLLLLTQMRALIDFSGKQNLLRFVSDLWIDELAALYGDEADRLPAAASTCTERFLFGTVGSYTVPVGASVTDGSNVWTVLADTSVTDDDHVDALVTCAIVGETTNGVAEGQIATFVNPSVLPACIGVTNVTETINGREIEALEDYRARLRDIPESDSVAGPRVAYEARALNASTNVADAVALGPFDGGDMAGTVPSPGQVFMFIIEGERDDAGNLLSVVPDPSDGLLSTVGAALSAEDARPLADQVIEAAPLFVDIDVFATYWIAESREESASEIEAAAQAAFAAYLLWQQSSIGLDVNPDQLRGMLIAAGVKRIDVGALAYTVLKRDQSAKVIYSSLTFGGVEDD